MESLEFLLMISIILLSTKAFGIFIEKFHIPQVVGTILAGIILGPSFLKILKPSEFIFQVSEIGVILLMFLAGLETNLKELKKNLACSFLIAIMGIIFPLILGSITYLYFFKNTYLEPLFILKGFFIGVVLTATSVSITIETLRSMGKLNSKIGTLILGAAIIDDIIGMIILSFIVSFTNPSVNIKNTLIKILLFFIFIIILGIFIKNKKSDIEKHNEKRRIAIYFLAFCLLISYISEHFFGVADITGAYFSGLILCNLKTKKYVEKKLSILSYLVFSPIFFANIGIKTKLDGFSYELFMFTVILLIVAILTKVFGCWLGCKIFRLKNNLAIPIGIGMVSRGEVALILAEKGINFKLLDENIFPSIIVVVILTTLLTPILLKISLIKYNKV